jgi:peptide deformylase
MKIVYFGDPILRQECEDVVVNEETIKIADEMVEAMRIYKGIGLAGPQVGYSKKIIVIRYTDEDEPLYIFNLKIIEFSQEKNVMEEGCLSLPGIWEKVVRPEKIRVSYQDRNGEEHVETLEGIEARVFQHEGDHLYGKLFIDHISLLKRKLIKKKLDNIRKGIIPEEFLPEEK